MENHKQAKADVLRQISDLCQKLLADGMKPSAPEAEKPAVISIEAEASEPEMLSESPGNPMESPSNESEDPDMLAKLKQLYEQIG